MKEADEEMKYWKGQLKNWDSQINQHEKTLKQAMKKGKGTYNHTIQLLDFAYV